MAGEGQVASVLSEKEHSLDWEAELHTLMLGRPLVDTAPHSKAGSWRSTPQFFWRVPSEGLCFFDWMVPSANTPGDMLEKKPWSKYTRFWYSRRPFA